MKKTNKITRFLSVVFCVALIVAMALSLTACNQTKEDKTPSSSDTVSDNTATKIGDGATEFEFTVTDKDGNVTEFTVCTDKTVVGDALLDAGLIEGEEGQYGLYVTKVNGIVADYNIDQTYWAFYIDGQYASTGVDQTNIEVGKTYEFKVSK